MMIVGDKIFLVEDRYYTAVTGMACRLNLQFPNSCQRDAGFEQTSIGNGQANTVKFFEPVIHNKLHYTIV